MTPFARASFALAALLVTFAAAPAEAAGGTKQCLQSARSGQVLRDAGKMVEARAAFVECAQSTCPRVVQKDCAQWQADVEARTPTVVLAAKDSGGRRLTDVKVTVDGKPFADQLDGRSQPIDPGRRRLRFEAAGAPAVDEEVVFLEGERARAVEVTIKIPGSETQVADDKTQPPVQPPDEVKSGPGALPWIFAGVGVVGLGAFVGLTASASGDYSDLEKKCKPNCSDSEVDPVRTKVTLSYVALGIGAAAAVTSIVLFATGSNSQSGVRVQAVFSPTMNGLEVRGAL